MVDHLIITPITYVSFKAKSLVDELKKSERIEKERSEKFELAMVKTLFEKVVEVVSIAKIMEITRNR